jgi:hypothetical protein
MFRGGLVFVPTEMPEFKAGFVLALGKVTCK